MNILIIGCDTGYEAGALVKSNPSAKIYGVDISEESIKKAKENFPGNNFNFIVSKAEKLPYADNFFDRIICFETLEHVFNVSEVIDEIKRVSRKKALIEISFPAKESEEILTKLNRDYFKQIGHRRIINPKLINALFGEGYELIKIKKYNSIEHLMWKYLFSNNYKILNQNAKLSKPIPLWLKLLVLFLDQEETKQKYSFLKLPKIIFYPISKILDKFFPNKKVKITLLKS